MLLARVRDASEAAVAVAAGFAGVIAVGEALAASFAPGVIVGRFERQADGGSHLRLVGGERPLALRVITGAALSHGALPGLPGAADGVAVESEGRLLDVVGLSALACLVAAAHERGLTVVLDGDLEAPDVPRLLALGADGLVLGATLREGAALDPARCRALAALAAPPTAPRPADRTPDRIFVRDLVLSVAIGAYQSERGRLQRVRFAVEADLDPLGTRAEGMASIVSYDLIIDAVHRLTDGRHVVFVETLAEEIAAALLAVPRIAAVRVTVEKLDIGPGAVGVAIERQRP